MNKEEIQEYLKRVEELEAKLEGEDNDTLHWLIYGYNQCARLLVEAEKENKQLQQRIDKAIEYLENQDYYKVKYTLDALNYDKNYLLEILKGELIYDSKRNV